MPLHLSRPAIAHIRFDGRSFDVPFAELGIAEGADDRAITRAVARHLDVAEERLHDCVLDRHETGNVTIRPEAVFG
jgi:hypothetical protein